ncbi:hypothetical protein OG413_40890 [Streptomyces sp. NBC_01433]|uniref:hypothetical protein n=1 Tax=Streptomyces sp. NBC_01433 TaxID=2903864 RepID=UPI00224DF8BC|nr:hypothetical protein [Streptomyces sp. NBC_01433]MCX4681560.1 hypothetical protein [Streptomyces sp. NBC_01433]
MTHDRDDEFPVPLPGDTARLDQLSARWRDADPAARQEVIDAAHALGDAPDATNADWLMDALSQARLDPDADDER